MKLEELVLNEAALNIGQLSKHPRYDFRVDVLLNKITKQEPVELVNGKTVVLQNDPQLVKVLTARDWDAFTSQFKGSFRDTDGNTVKLTQIQKTKEFGGEQAGKRLAKEDFAIEQLNAIIHKIKRETGSDSVAIVVGKNVYPNIVQATSTPGTPKSDFHLINKAGDAVVWISHKDGNSAKSFQQWSGITEAGIVDHAETKTFVSLVKQEIADQGLEDFPRGQTWGHPIRSPKLAKMAVFGVDFGKEFGINNVQLTIQGNVTLTPNENGEYVLSGDHVVYNGQVPKGDYAPYFMVRYLSDRSNFGIKYARMSISPLGSRKVHKVL